MSSSDRTPYKSATVLDQALLDRCFDNLECDLEMVCNLELPTPPGGFIRISDRNKYVGNVFYEALAKFPVISRTVGDWLTPEVQFSGLNIEFSNADGRFNPYLAGGAQYKGFVGKAIDVKIGLRDVAATYSTIFSGKVTDIAGAKRSVKSISVVARDTYDALKVTFPNSALTKDVYPQLEDNLEGTILPVIYGDWTVSLGDNVAIVPTYFTNGGDPNVAGGSRNNIQIRISDNDLSFFDTANVYMKRGETTYAVPTSQITNIASGNFQFEVLQNTGVLWLTVPAPAIAYLWEPTDVFTVRVKGKDLGAYDDNIVEQARDIAITYGGLTSGQFDANWNTYRGKATPAQSAISTIKSRIWENEPKPVIQYVLSLLEQVRLEAFITRDQMFKISSLHFEDFEANPSFTVKNWDVVAESFVPGLDDQNNFNRAQAVFDFHPTAGESTRLTAIHKNADAIAQFGFEISKRITFPNLYESTDVVNQLIEILKLSSAIFEIVDVSLTWRAMLQEIGGFVNLDVKIGSVIFDKVPCLIRSIGYDPDGLKIPVLLWSFQMCPFPGYVPGYSGTVGGYNATIISE